MKPPVYKTVTTKEGVMLFVDEEGIEIMHPNDFAIINGNEIFKWRNNYSFRGARKIIAQPLESNLSGIPYYELTPQEERVEQLADKANGYLVYSSKAKDTKANAFSEGFIEGYKAAKAKGGFTEEQMHDAIEWGFQMALGNTNHKRRDLFIASLRQPMKIVSSEPVMIIDESIEPISTGNYPHHDDYCYKPETYEKDGKTFIKLTNIKYE